VYFRAPRADDDRSPFRSGDPELDRFFLKYARQNQFRHHIGTTYVAVERGRVVGFAAIAPGQLESESLSPPVGRGLPKYPLPILRLARLAVDDSYRGQGVGKELLCAVFELALAMSGKYGCLGVLVDAKPDAVKFYSHFGFMAIIAAGGTMHTAPSPVPMFLSVPKLKRG